MDNAEIKEAPKRRSFLGKLNGFESKDERNRETKHLKSYLKGYKYYTHGFETVNGKRERKYYEVQQAFN